MSPNHKACPTDETLTSGYTLSSGSSPQKAAGTAVSRDDSPATKSI
jgi:hypothetical protein